MILFIENLDMAGTALSIFSHPSEVVPRYPYIKARNTEEQKRLESFDYTALIHSIVNRIVA